MLQHLTRKKEYRKAFLSFLLIFYCFLGFSQTTDVVIVDENYPNTGGLLASLPVNVKYVKTNSAFTFQQALEDVLIINPEVSNIHLFCNTDSNTLTIGNNTYQESIIAESIDNSLFKENVNLLVYSCSLAKSTMGIQLLESIASATNWNVASCSSCNSIDEEFTFDFSTSNTSITNTLFK